MLLGIYLYFNQGLVGEALLSSEEAVSSDALLDTQNLLQRFQVFESVKLDNVLFVDERFKSLVDFRQPVVPTAIGRANPYVPVE